MEAITITEEQRKQLTPDIQALILTEEQCKQFVKAILNLGDAVRTFFAKMMRQILLIAQRFTELGYCYKNTKRFRWRNWDKARRRVETKIRHKGRD